MDPFDFSNADPNAAGFLGIAPSAWRDLAAFGGNLASAANARTASGHLANGTGFAGPLGAAIGPTMEFGRQNAVTRSNLGMQAANTRGRQIENMLLESSLPTQLARNKMLQDIFQDPAKLNQLMQQFGGGGAPSGSAAGMMAGGQASPTGSPATAPAEYMPFYQEASTRTGIPVNVLLAQAKQESNFNPNALGGAGEIGLHQILPSTAQKPGFGMAGVDPSTLRDPRANINFAADYLKARGGPRTDFSNPATVDAALRNYNGGGDPNYIANVRRYMGAGGASPAAGPRAQVPGSFQVAQAGQGALPVPPQPPEPQSAAQAPQQGILSGVNISPQEAMQRAEHYERQADILDRQISAADQASKLLGIPIARPEGDPAVKRAAASQFRQLALAGPKTAAEAQAGLPAKLAEQGFQSGPNGQTFIPGGKADPAYAGAVKAAEAASSNVDIRPGGQVRIMGPNGPEWVKNPQVEKIQLQNGDIALVHVTPPPPGSPPGTKGESTPIVDQNGQQIIEKRTQLNEFNQKRGGLLAEQFDKIDHDAASAKEGNYLFDNMRNDAKGFQMGRFAEWEGNARAWLSAISDKLGIESGPELKNKLSDFEAFRKSSGTLLRTAVHDTSSRAAAQEYNMIAQTLPTPTTSQQGFGQVADQWQALYDFRLAKQKFASGYEGVPSKLNVEFNSQVSPTSFMLNRMAQTPQGQVDMHTMLSRMSATPEGKLMAGRMLRQFEQTKKLGLFDELSPTGAQAPAQAP